MKRKLTFKRIHYEIIDYLNKHPFTSLSTMAKDLNYDRTTISKRVKELRERNVLSTYSTYIQSECLGFPICAYIYVKNMVDNHNLLDFLSSFNGTIMIEQLNEKDLIVAGYFTDCEQAYDYFSVCQKYGDAHMQIKLHTIEAAHPIYPPYLFKETEGIIHDPVAWRKELPVPNNNLKKLSKEELRFFKLISAYNLPYNLKTFCEEKNFELEFAEITIKKLIMQNIIYGFDLQINAKELGLAHCEHICIPHPTSQTFNAITENPNLELANLMSDGSVLLIIYGRDKEDVEKQLLEFAPLEEIQRYHVQNWVMKPRNVLPQWVVDIKVD